MLKEFIIPCMHLLFVFKALSDSYLFLQGPLKEEALYIKYWHWPTYILLPNIELDLNSMGITEWHNIMSRCNMQHVLGKIKVLMVYFDKS